MTAFLAGPRVALRPVEESDVEFLLAVDNDPDLRDVTGAVRPVTLREEVDWIRRRRAPDVALVAADPAGTPRGVALLRGADLVHRSAEVALAFPRAADPARAFEEAALALLVPYAFDELNLHRLTARLDAGHPGLATYRALGFRDEGAHREARWRDGAWRDEVALALLAREWRGRERA